MASVLLPVLFGLRVRELPETAGIPQESLANKFGFARSYMSKIERGKANGALDAIERLADGLWVEPKALFEPPASVTPSRPTRGRAQLLIPFASDGTCFNPTLRQPRAGTFVVVDKGERRTFTDFKDALAYLKAMKPARWWRPSAAGNLGFVTEVTCGPLPAEFN